MGGVKSVLSDFGGLKTSVNSCLGHWDAARQISPSEISVSTQLMGCSKKKTSYLIWQTFGGDS